MSQSTQPNQTDIELPSPTTSMSTNDKNEPHRSKTISMLYEERKNSFCLDINSPEQLIEQKHSLELTEQNHTSSNSIQKGRKAFSRTQSTMDANQSVLKGRVALVNKSRENSINHNHDNNDADSFKIKYRSDNKRHTPHCFGYVPIISPFSLSHSMWDLYIAFVLVVSLTSLPVGMAFDDVGDSMFGMNILIDFFFICDIVVTFITGFVDENDALIMKPWPIATAYLKSWFVMDVIASIPMDLILYIIEESQKEENMDSAELANLTKLFKMMRLVRMLKLLRLFRLSRVAKYVHSLRLWLQHHLMCSIPQAFLQISKLVILLVIVAHWLGCTFFMISKTFDHPYNSWVVQSGLIDKSTSEQYVWCFLKALYMIIGGEEMLPSGNGIGCNDVENYCAVESWMSMLALYIGIVFSALLISEIGIIVTSLDRSRQLYHDKLQEANEYMRANKLSPELREHVREYFALRYSDQKMFHEQTILEDLSPNLRTRIREEVSSNIVTRVPLLHENDKNHAFIDGIVTQLKGPLICFVNEVIFYEGTTGHEMYFIYSGVVGIFSKAGATQDNADPEGVAVAAISNGCFFGEVALLLNERRTATARSETITVLHTLHQDALKECLEDVPSIRDYMLHIANTRKQRVNQIDPAYTGEVDTTFESKDYVDMEDAKTPLFKYDKAVSRRKTALSKKKSRKSITRQHSKAGLHFSKQHQQRKQHSTMLQRLRRKSVHAVSSSKKERKRRSSMGSLNEDSDGGSIFSSDALSMVSEEEKLESLPGSPLRKGSEMVTEKDIDLELDLVNNEERKIPKVGDDVMLSEKDIDLKLDLVDNEERKIPKV